MKQFISFMLLVVATVSATAGVSSGSGSFVVVALAQPRTVAVAHREPCCLDSATHMLHFKIIGVIWLVLCLGATAVFAPQLWSMAMDGRYGIASDFHDVAFWISQFFAELFLLAGAMLVFGLFRLRRWAAICTRITAVLLLVYCLSFVLMSHFHVAWLAEIGRASCRERG